MIPSAYGRTVSAGATDRFVIGSLPQGTRVEGFYVYVAPPRAAAAVDELLLVRVAALRSVSDVGDNTVNVGEPLFRAEAASPESILVPVRTQVFIPTDFVIGEYSLTAFQVTLVNAGAVTLEAVVCPRYSLPRRRSDEVRYDPLTGR